jgi:hypothetical protein
MKFNKLVESIESQLSVEPDVIGGGKSYQTMINKISENMDAPKGQHPLAYSVNLFGFITRMAGLRYSASDEQNMKSFNKFVSHFYRAYRDSQEDKDSPSGGIGLDTRKIFGGHQKDFKDFQDSRTSIRNAKKIE